VTAEQDGPLAGIRILDLSWIIAGPLASRLLADYGADVIKIESRSRMDTGRANRTPLYGVLPGDANTNPDTGGYFQDANAGKRSCTINLALDEGKELLRELVVASDVTICNLAGDQYDRWGIGYDVIRELNTGIIMVNMPTMESHGPRSQWRGFGDMFVGISGLKSISGHPQDGPLPFGHHYADFASNPFHAAVSIIAALLHRDRTGEGQFIEVGQYESTVAMLGPTFLEAGVTDSAINRAPESGAPAQIGNRDAEAVPHNFYPASSDTDDAWCAIAVFDDTQWQSLVDFADLPALRNPAWTTAEARRASEPEIDAILDAWTAPQDPHTLAEALQQQGVPAGPFQEVPDLVDRDPSMGTRYFESPGHPSGREFLVHGSPALIRDHPSDIRHAPLLGEHTYEILSDVLHYTPDRIADLAARGILD
jgi:crotonobetainyl-CoA:carnitine CoA-transferase CaiB-like acyl-CoA transferase